MHGLNRRRAAWAVLAMLCVAQAAMGEGEWVDPYPTRNPKAPEYDAQRPGALVPMQLVADGFVLVDVTHGEVLMERNAHAPYPSAAINRLMAALVAAERGALDDALTTPASVERLPEYVTVLPLAVGEELSLNDALHALVLRAALDAAVTIADHYAGSEAAYVAWMQEKADALGCEDTVFTDVTGIGASQHTTPADMARILAAALHNEALAAILAATAYDIPATNLHGARHLTSINALASRGDVEEGRYYHPHATAGQTAFVDGDGYYAVFAAEKEGRTLIAAQCRTGKYSRWVDAVRLFNYGYAQPYVPSEK